MDALYTPTPAVNLIAPTGAQPEGESIVMAGRKSGTQKAEGHSFLLSPTFERMIELVVQHYAATTGDRFEDRSVYWTTQANKSTAIHIAIADWLVALRAGESATLDALRAELEEHYVATNLREGTGRQIYFSAADDARYEELVKLLKASKNSFANGRTLNLTMVIGLALARYVRVNNKRRIGLCHDLADDPE